MEKYSTKYHTNQKIFKLILPNKIGDIMNIDEYPDSFKMSKEFIENENNPFREIATNLIEAIYAYVEEIDKNEKYNIINSMLTIDDMNKYEDELTNLIFDERKDLENAIFRKDGKVAKYIKDVIFSKYKLDNKFDEFFDIYSSVE